MADKTDAEINREDEERELAAWEAQGKKLLKWPVAQFVGALDTKSHRKEAFECAVEVKNSEALIGAMASLQKDLRESSAIGLKLRRVGISLACVLAASAIIQAGIALCGVLGISTLVHGFMISILLIAIPLIGRF